MTRDLMTLIHGENIYDGYEDTEFKTDLQGWGGHVEFFEQMLRLSQPRLIAEIGTWKGKSACAMAHYLDDSVNVVDRVLNTRGGGPADVWFRDTKIVCVDTWLGAAEFMGKKPGDKRYLHPSFGYPQVYYQFLSNVVNESLQHRIVPFPQTSTNAARFFEKNDVKFDLIYVDASHEYVDVKADLNAWYPRLNDGGLMFGDDFCSYWQGVIDAVTEFAFEKRLVLQTKRYENPNGEAPSDYWTLSKNGIVLP